MAHAYEYANGRAPYLPEIEAYSMVQVFGAQAVFGRILTVSEMRRMTLARRIYDAVKARGASKSWAEWAEKNPDDNRLVTAAMKAVNNG